MTPPYVPLETIQLLSETSFSKIKNKSYLGWDIKMGHPVYKISLAILNYHFTQEICGTFL